MCGLVKYRSKRTENENNMRAQSVALSLLHYPSDVISTCDVSAHAQ